MNGDVECVDFQWSGPVNVSRNVDTSLDQME